MFVAIRDGSKITNASKPYVMTFHEGKRYKHFNSSEHDSLDECRSSFREKIDWRIPTTSDYCTDDILLIGSNEYDKLYGG